VSVLKLEPENVDRGLVRAGGRAEQARRLAVEGALEVALAVYEQQPAYDHQAGDADPEADLLDARVGLHAHRHDDAHEREHYQAGHEDACLAGEEGGDAGPAKRVGERREELDDQDVGVDRRPEEQGEPPSGDGQHEAKPAAQHPALPRVVAARARHDAHQHRVSDDKESSEHAEQQDRGEQLAVRDRVYVRHAVKP
jgi:hypothetical protein